LRAVNLRWREAVQAVAVRTVILAAPVLVFLLVAVVSLRRSVECGRLSIPPFYDDVVYLFYSQLVIHSVAHQSFLATAYQIVNQHSPLTTFFGVVGYWLVPLGELGPYVVSSGHVLLYLLACALLLRSLPALLVVGVVCAVGAVPMLRIFIVEFRPEPAWATLTAVSAIAFFAMNLLTGSRRGQIGIGLLAGLAVISKPTTAPVTIVVLGVAFIASVLVQYVESRQCGRALPLRAAILAAVTVWTALLVVVLPIGAIIGREVYDYIVWVMTAVTKQVGLRGGVTDQLLFYSFGPGGLLLLGWALPISLAAWGIGIAYALLRQRSALPRILAVFAVILVSYLIPSVTVAKSVWFGSAFDAILVLATAYLIALLGETIAGWSHLPAKLRAVVSTSGGIAGISLLLISNLIAQPSGLLGLDLAARNDITNRTARIWDVLRKHELVRKEAEPPGHISNVMTIAIEPIAGPVIGLYGVKEDLPIRGADYSYASSIDELLTQLPNMDYVVVGPSYKFVLNGAGLGDALRDAMDTKPQFSRIAALPIGRFRAFVEIYERRLP
jgi:hypothetical protein